MNLMQGRFFTSSRILVSFITILITASAGFAFSELVDFLFGDAETLGAIIFVFPALFIFLGGSGLVFFLVRVFLGSKYLDEETERSILYGFIEIAFWVVLVLGLIFLFYS